MSNEYMNNYLMYNSTFFLTYEKYKFIYIYFVQANAVLCLWS